MNLNIDKAKKELILRAYERGITKPRDFMILKNEISEEFKVDSLPNYGLTQIYEKLVKDKNIKTNKGLEKLLRKAKVRTLSGVAVVSVLTKPYACPGNCLYCPTEKDMPKSYLSNEPAVMRAILCEFDPYRQVIMRLEALKKAGHSTDKIELIIMGGSFNSLPLDYQYWFVGECFRACNHFAQKNQKSNLKNQNLGVASRQYLIFNIQLKTEQIKNEKARSRIIGLTLETRPDLINEKELLKFREMGCTRIEIGVQSIYDDILKKNKRGHGVKEIIEATKLMKDFGFKISYHMMPGLYGSSPKKDLEMFKELFSNSDFQPDQLKIYPCVVVKDSELYDLWKMGKYKPYTPKQLEDLLCDIKKIIPPYIRISRLIRDIPEESILAGNKITNLRQVIDNRSQKEGWRCQCIRCREIRDKESFNHINKKTKLKTNRIEYNASGGKEVFLELVDNDYHLYALLRLRIVETQNFASLPGAIIREIHTYGEAIDVGKKGEASQHKGLGQKLIIEAEKIAKEMGCDKIAVISGVGVRGYYKKLGYNLEDTYMVKKL
uniref:tRNA carboxymethyluridine synthase n=1 Tax=candidate division CPR3 bacterium TaxID=2268181 RepID=A0A7C4M0E3_UNCC3